MDRRYSWTAVSLENILDFMRNNSIKTFEIDCSNNFLVRSITSNVSVDFEKKRASYSFLNDFDVFENTFEEGDKNLLRFMFDTYKHFFRLEPVFLYGVAMGVLMSVFYRF